MGMRKRDANGKMLPAPRYLVAQATPEGTIIVSDASPKVARELAKRHGVDLKDAADKARAARRARFQKRENFYSNAKVASQYKIRALNGMRSIHRTVVDGDRSWMEQAGFPDTWTDEVMAYLGRRPFDNSVEWAQDFQAWLNRTPAASRLRQAIERKRSAVDRKTLEDEEAERVADVVAAAEDDTAAEGFGAEGIEIRLEEQMGLAAWMVENSNNQLDPVTGDPVQRKKDDTLVMRSGKAKGMPIAKLHINPLGDPEVLTNFVKQTGRGARKVMNTFNEASDLTIDTIEAILKPIDDLIFNFGAYADYLPEASRPFARSLDSRMKRFWTTDDPDGHIRTVLGRMDGELNEVDRKAVSHARAIQDIPDTEMIDIYRRHEQGLTDSRIVPTVAWLDDIGQKLVDAGLLRKAAFDKLKGRYVPRTRWVWTKEGAAAAVEALKAEARKLRTELRGADADKAGVLAARMKEVQNSIRALRRSQSLLTRLGQKVGIAHTARVPLGLSHVAADFAGRSASRHHKTIDEAIEGGLDINGAWKHMIDGVRQEAKALVTHEWAQRMADDSRIARDFGDAPDHWVVVTQEDLADDKMWRPLLGKQMHPQAYEWLKAKAPSQNAYVRLYDNMHGAAKMAVTMFNFGNWAQQAIGNPMIMMGSEMNQVKAYDWYVRGFFASIGKGKWAKNLDEYRLLNFVGQPTDVDRELAQSMMHEGHRLEGTMRATLTDVVEGMNRLSQAEFRKSARSMRRGGRNFMEMVLGLYRNLDAGARIGLYEHARQPKEEGGLGLTDEDAANLVNRRFDIMHISRFGRGIRRLPVLGSSFASFQSVMVENRWDMLRGSQRGFIGMAAAAAMWKAAVMSLHGMEEEEADQIMADSVDDVNPVTHWINEKTSFFMGPTGVIKMDRHFPILAAKSYIPGAEPIIEGTVGGTGRSNWGRDMWAESFDDMIGGNILTGPHALYFKDWALNRNEGRLVRRWQDPGLMGASGYLRMVLETGAAAAPAAPLGGKLFAAATGSILRGGARFEDQGLHPLITSDKVDVRPDGSLEVRDWDSTYKPRTREEKLAAFFGFRVSRPNAFNRLIREAQGNEGLTIGRGEKTVIGVPEGTPAYESAKAAQGRVTAVIKALRSNDFMLEVEMLRRHADDEEYAQRQVDTIMRKWKTFDSRLQAIKDFADMTKQHNGDILARYLPVLESFGIIDPSVKAPPARALIVKENTSQGGD
jgi:hypothetical protein